MTKEEILNDVKSEIESLKDMDDVEVCLTYVVDSRQEAINVILEWFYQSDLFGSYNDYLEFIRLNSPESALLSNINN